MAHRGIDRKPYWLTLRLLSIASQNWQEINAECILAGVNARKMHPLDFLDLVSYMISRNKDEKELDKLWRSLWMPPNDEEPEPDNPYWGEISEMNQFDKNARKGISQ